MVLLLCGYLYVIFSNLMLIIIIKGMHMFKNGCLFYFYCSLVYDKIKLILIFFCHNISE